MTWYIDELHLNPPTSIHLPSLFYGTILSLVVVGFIFLMVAH